MALAPINPTQLTPPRVALIDERSGAISREWYRFFLSLLTATETNQQEVGTAPDANALMATYDSMLASLAQDTQTNTSDLAASLQQQINDVFTATAVTPPPTGGTVTSVDASGGTTGLTFTGGPITTSGTLVLGGTLAITNGGTGATNATDARTNLGAAASGANSDITSMSGLTGPISSPTYIQMGSGSGTTLAAGRMWYNQTTGTWNMGMGGGNITQQVGEELFRYGKASAAITDSPLQLVYKTGAVGASGVITFAPAVAGIVDSDQIIGCATEDIPLNGFGRVTTYGIVNGINTTGSSVGETWTDNTDLYYNPLTGGLTKNVPVAPGIKVLIGTVINAGLGGSGSFVVKLGVGASLNRLADVQLTSPANNDLLQYYAAGPWWRNVASTSVSVTSFSAGTTGLTPSTATQGAVTLAGTLVVGNGGTGATTLTGYVKGNGTSAFTASTTIPASDVTGLATVATSGSFADLSNKPGIRSNGQNVISATKTLGAADSGTNILIATSGITITFPATGFASGEGFAISNVSGGNVTLSAPGGSDFGATLPNDGTFFAFCDGGGFWRQYCYSTTRL
jgi:hypothetical protein